MSRLLQVTGVRGLLLGFLQENDYRREGGSVDYGYYDNAGRADAYVGSARSNRTTVFDYGSMDRDCAWSSRRTNGGPL